MFLIETQPRTVRLVSYLTTLLRARRVRISVEESPPICGIRGNKIVFTVADIVTSQMKKSSAHALRNACEMRSRKVISPHGHGFGKSFSFIFFHFSPALSFAHLVLIKPRAAVHTISIAARALLLTKRRVDFSADIQETEKLHRKNLPNKIERSLIYSLDLFHVTQFNT